jgi:hypothetical protein
MPKNGGSREDLVPLIESYEFEIDCRHCGWSGRHNVGWLNARRDMNCPACRGVIVLNTSERRRQIAALRRQVAALREQLHGSILYARSVLSGAVSARQGAGAPLSKLGLWQLYGGGRRRHSPPAPMQRLRR